MTPTATSFRTVLAAASLATVAAIGLPLSPALPQAAVNLIVVDVAAVAHGYRASKLIRSGVGRSAPLGR